MNLVCNSLLCLQFRDCYLPPDVFLHNNQFHYSFVDSLLTFSFTLVFTAVLVEKQNWLLSVSESLSTVRR